MQLALRDASDSPLNLPSGLLFGAARLPLTVEGTAFARLAALFTKPLFITCFMNVHSVPRPGFHDVKNTLNMGCTVTVINQPLVVPL